MGADRLDGSGPQAKELPLIGVLHIGISDKKGLPGFYTPDNPVRHNLLQFGLLVQMAALLAEALAHLLHAGSDGLRVGDELLLCFGITEFFADVLADGHGAELRTAHRTEMRHLRRLGRQSIIMERDGGVRIVAQVELVKPTEFETCLLMALSRSMACG